jgi:AraC-like DNA-binding protein
MIRKESVSEFYSRHGHIDKETRGFNVYNRENFSCDSTSLPPNRRDFYKISIITKGSGILSYADKSIRVDKPSITFFNPMIPYSWEPTSEDQGGYFCLFTEDFITRNFKNESLAQSPLFKVGGEHLFFPNTENVHVLKGHFENMIREIHSDYTHKYDLLRSYVQIIMHEAMKMQPPGTFYQPANASERITKLFVELLELQFPIDSPSQALKLNTANEFSAQLNVHTNTLNRALKEYTGKTTTEWITERILQEAKALLQYSSWDISQVAFSLGFEHASNFIFFFKKQTAITPLQFRKNTGSVYIKK